MTVVKCLDKQILLLRSFLYIIAGHSSKFDATNRLITRGEYVRTYMSSQLQRLLCAEMKNEVNTNVPDKQRNEKPSDRSTMSTPTLMSSRLRYTSAIVELVPFVKNHNAKRASDC